MSNNIWSNTTIVTRSASVVPAFIGSTGDVCPQAAGYAVPSRKRQADLVMAAHTGVGSVPWSPPDS